MKHQGIAAGIAGLTTVAALALLIDRGGLIAWSAFLIGVALLAKIWWKPSRFDAVLGIGLVAIAALAWIGTRYYVISTWESAEVVELSIDTDNGVQTARLWVLDIGGEPLIYYDAEPEVARSLLAGKPLQFTRGEEVSTRIPSATPVDSLPEHEARRILEAMESKYGSRVGAATIYYLMLGRSRDRVALVANLVEE